MILPSVLVRALPYALVATALALTLVSLAALVTLSRRAAMGGGRAPPKRLYLGFVLSCAPLVHAGLVDAGIVRETWLRYGWPLVLVPGTLVLLFAQVRLESLPASLGETRRATVRTLAFLALFTGVLAAADTELGRPRDGLTVVIAEDRSRSMDLVPNAEARMAKERAAATAGMHDADRIGIVTFAADAVTDDPPHVKAVSSTPQKTPLGRDASDLERAVRRALAELPDDTAGRIVLVTDGVETRGDVLAAASLALAKDVPIDVLPFDQAKQNNVRVVSVRAPSRADEDEPLDLRVVTASTIETDVDIRVLRDGVPLHTGRAHLAAGEDVLKIRELAPSAGLHRYDVSVSARNASADSSPDDDTGAAFVRVRGVSLALVIEGDAGKSAPWTSALRGAGFRVVEGGASVLPTDVAGLAAFDLVVLSDVRASDLTKTQVDAMASYARDLGGGLVLMGGDRSFGPGGYARSAIEEVSPVSFDLRQKQRRASLAEVIAIDYSGSMGMEVSGQTKLALANEAAARSASLLGPGDRLGVEHVDTVVAWTQPMAPVDNPKAIADKIRQVGVGGGGIYTDLALEAAYAALAREQVNLKHVLLFADGGDAEQITGCRAMVAAAHAKGMTTSVISLGEGSDTPELAELAKAGEGRFYLIDDATKLPAVFTQETVLASRSALVEKPFRVSAAGSGPATRGIAIDALPALRGYVVTLAKPRAEILLAGPDGDPVLATWPVGLGRTAAFTSDYKDRWGSDWIAHAPAAKLFGQLARDTARREDDPRVHVESDVADGRLRVRGDVSSADGRADSFRRLHARIAGPDGFSADRALTQTGPGRYEADVPLSRKGTYVTAVVDDETGAVVSTAGATLAEGQEATPTGSDRTLLARVAQVSGGKVRESLAGVFDDRGERRFSHLRVAHVLSAVSLVALFASVACRKLSVPETLVRAVARMRVRRATHREGDLVRLREEAERLRAQARATRALTEATRVRVRPDDTQHGDDLASKLARVKLETSVTTKVTPSAARSSTDSTIGARSAVSPSVGDAPQKPVSSVELLAKRRRERRD